MAKDQSNMSRKPSLRERLLFFFFPPKCVVCGEMGYSPLCPQCDSAVSSAFAPNSFLADGGNGYADQMFALFSYDDRAPKKLILLWKAHDLDELPQIFQPYIEAWYQKEKKAISLVSYVPRRPVAVRENGFDQAKRIATVAAHSLNLPMETLLDRRGRSKKQHSLPRAKRQGNVEGIFYPVRRLSGETVLLIDDIVTSGASARECARILKKAGAQKVFVLCLAH